MKYIDTHAHYLARQFAKDRNELIPQLLNTDLEYIIECGTNALNNRIVIKNCEKFDKVFGVIGFFPTNVSELKNEVNYNDFLKQLKHPKIVGLGEVGLDYYHDKAGASLQKEYFIKQLELAQEFNLPVCIHSRDAEADTLKILQDFGKNHGVIHCYAYGVRTMEKLVDLGYYFGVGGTSTYVQNVELRDAIRRMPIERIVLETDAPYLSPAQVRRTRNDSSHIKYVISEIAKLKNISEVEVIEKTNENAHRLYPKLK